MKQPTEAQITRAAQVLREIRDNGTHRPGDAHIDHDIEAQLHARATDVAAILLNQEFITNG